MEKLSFPKEKIKVLLLGGIHRDAARSFRDEGYPVEKIDSSMSEEELADKIKGVFILGIRSKTQITKKVLESADKLLAIGTFCIGTNQVDLEACNDKGIVVFNAPFSNTRSVAELALGEIVMLLRRIPDFSNKMHRGVWEKSALGSCEVRGKKLGIIGLGNIGTQLAVLAENLGMGVYYFDVEEKLAPGNVEKCDSMEDLLRKCDAVSIHVDGRKENTKLIGDAELSLMKEGSVFLNLSRGFVVDEEALARQVKEGRIKGAAVDVYSEEPKSNAEGFASPLQGLPNVILTPHIGGATEEAQLNIARYVPKKLIGFVNTGSSHGSPNFPNLKLEPVKDAHRFIHIHENVPGILMQLNEMFGKHNINILGQHLKTNESIGYVITDVSKEHSPDLTEALKAIPGTIRVRVLY